MLKIRNEKQVVSQVEVDAGILELVARESSVALATGSYGFSISYCRPTEVRAPDASSPVRDHVMLVRLIAGLIFLISAARRFADG